VAGIADPVVIGDETCRVTLHPLEGVSPHGLKHRLDVVAGPFRGSLVVHSYDNPYRHFHEQLNALYQTLSGEARLGPGYEDLEIVFSGDGKGHIAVKVVVHANYGRLISLEFQVFLDQTELSKIIRHVEEAFIRDVL
jgi:hypothetical protein